MFGNTIFFKNIENYRFKFKKLLKTNNTLHFTNCSNIDLFLNQKINKIIIENCNDINIRVGHLISGIEIIKSSDINIFIKKNKKINCLELFKSNINVNKLNYRLINEKSYIKI